MGASLDPATITAEVAAAHPEVTLALHIDPVGDLVLDKLIVPVDRRSSGVGSAVMDLVTAAADDSGIRMALTPTDDFGGTVTRLRRFYKRWGFVENTGRSRDFSTRQAMLREPAAP